MVAKDTGSGHWSASVGKKRNANQKWRRPIEHCESNVTNELFASFLATCQALGGKLVYVACQAHWGSGTQGIALHNCSSVPIRSSLNLQTNSASPTGVPRILMPEQTSQLLHPLWWCSGAVHVRVFNVARPTDRTPHECCLASPIL